MKKIISILKRAFGKNKVIDLFESNNEATLAELGGNYCSDSC